MKKRLFWLIMLALPVVLVLALEGLLRLTDQGGHLRLIRATQDGNERWLEINPDIGRRYFGQNPDFARQAEPARLAVEKPGNGYRIICLGGSTMAGFPYNQNATMPGILRTYLRRLFPDRPIEVINLGIAAVNSYAVRDLMHDVVGLQPDAIVVYAGHNEFYGALGVGSRFSYGSNRWLVNLYLRLLRTRSFVLLQQSIWKLRRWLDPPADPDNRQPVMQRMARQQQIAYRSDLFTAAESIFASNLEDVAALAASAKIPLFIGSLVSNLRDHAPFISSPADSLTPAMQSRWQAVLASGKAALDQGKHQRAQSDLLEAMQIDSASAELHFLLAQSHLGLAQVPAALMRFRRARDLDVLRFRAPSSFNAIIRDLCANGSAILVDVETAFAGNSRSGIIGSELVTEHLHPNARGYALMARSFLTALAHSKNLPERGSAERIARLPLAPDSLGITHLDLEIGRQRIAGLTAAWPFKQQVMLTVPMDDRSAGPIRDIAARYIAREMSWFDAHLKLAQTLEGKKAFDLALTEYLALLQLHPAEASLHERAGDCHISMAQYGRAMWHFSRAAELNPGSPYAFAGIGKVAMYQSQFEPARESLARAIALDDRRRVFSKRYRSFITYLWGGALTNLGQYALARSKFEEAIDLDAGNNLARSFLETLEQKLKESGRN